MNNIDWSTAPEEAAFYANGKFWLSTSDGFGYNCGSKWIRSDISYETLSLYSDFESRPKQWPTEARIDNIGRNRTEDDMGHYDNEREQHEAKHDPVNNPKHYAIAPSVEAIDIIKASLTPEQFKGYLLGNFLKYRLRAGDKGDLQQDIDKSNWYRERLNDL